MSNISHCDSEMMLIQDHVPDGERKIWQLTNSSHRSYPLYYFSPTITKNGRYLVFHSERTTWIQLYRLDLLTGEITQLTNGKSLDCGWAMWCEWHLRGVSNHLSTLNLETNKVIYFDGAEIRAVHVESLADRPVGCVPSGRRSIGQTSCSPDGNKFLYLHVDDKSYVREVKRRESISNAGGAHIGDNWRLEIGGTVLSEIDLRTGAERDVVTFENHVHHVIHRDNDVAILNHPKGHMGMILVDLKTSDFWVPRSPGVDGAVGEACHQVVTASGVYYEAYQEGHPGGSFSLGRLGDDLRSYVEYSVSGLKGWHTGYDPDGRFVFLDAGIIEDSDRHVLVAISSLAKEEGSGYKILADLKTPFGIRGQRNHTHPLLTPDRKNIIYSDHDENGVTQIYKLDVSDLVDDPLYLWPAENQET